MASKTSPPAAPEETGARTGTGKTPPDRKTGFALLVSSESGVAVHPLEGARFVIGRAAECDLPVNDSSISRRHARLVIDETMTVEDLGSTNGTRVQGRRIERGDKVNVSLGTVFELGSATFVLQRARGFDAQRTAPGETAKPVPPPGSDGPILCDPTMRHLYALLDLIAPTPLNVLVLGETGVGKEVYAEAVHHRSDRRHEAFLRLNCAALPESILEGELFGYEKGAFTGAVQAKAGLFESAHGGTVFLDEIGEVPLSIQAKLLRVLESGEMMRLGALHPKKVDVRFVAATNRDLRQRIVEGAFRADLYFRLNGMTITLPPLRKRKADIGPLAEHLIERTAARLRRPRLSLSEGAREALGRHTWPGNVRELRNVIERAVVMSTGDELLVSHLLLADPEAFGGPPDDEVDEQGPTDPATSVRDLAAFPRTPAPDETLENERPSLRIQLKAVEKDRIVDALAESGGNQSQAAKRLGISRYTLMARMEEYGIARPRKGRSG